MSTYKIKKFQSGVQLTYDGAHFEPGVMLQYAKPTFDYGTHSDPALNLAYAILLHHSSDEALAQALANDFIGRYLLRSDPQIEISDKQIQDFIHITRAVHQQMVKINRDSKNT